MQFKYILYFIFLSLFACEHHSSNINIKNKPEETKSIVQKKEIKEIKKIKKEVYKKFGKQKYLDHLPHLTIFDLKVNQFLISKKFKNEIKIENLNTRDLKLSLKKRYYFKTDPITKKCTFVIFVKKNEVLKKIQQNLLKKFKSIKQKRNIRFKNAEFNKNNNKFGYPFVNKSWKPHLTIASVNKNYISDSLFKNFLKSKKHLHENYKYIYFYKYSNRRHYFLWKSKILND